MLKKLLSFAITKLLNRKPVIVKQKISFVNVEIKININKS